MLVVCNKTVYIHICFLFVRPQSTAKTNRKSFHYNRAIYNNKNIMYVNMVSNSMLRIILIQLCRKLRRGICNINLMKNVCTIFLCYVKYMIYLIYIIFEAVKTFFCWL